MNTERKLKMLVFVSSFVSIAAFILCEAAAKYLFTLRVNSVYLHYLLIFVSFFPALLSAGFAVSLYFLARLWLELKEPM